MNVKTKKQEILSLPGRGNTSFYFSQMGAEGFSADQQRYIISLIRSYRERFPRLEITGVWDFGMEEGTEHENSLRGVFAECRDNAVYNNATLSISYNHIRVSRMPQDILPEELARIEGEYEAVRQISVMAGEMWDRLRGEGLPPAQIRQCVEEAAARVGISPSAYYKYRDAVTPFQDLGRGRIVTFQLMLRHHLGVLSAVLGLFAGTGANILTINQSLPVNGTAAVTISAETAGMSESMETLMTRLLGDSFSSAEINFICYAVGVLYMLVCAGRFLRRDFDPLCDNLLYILLEVIICYGLMLCFNLILSGLLTLAEGLISNFSAVEFTSANPNNNAVIDMTTQGFGMVEAMAVFLAPIVEELMFRAGLFGLLRRRSRVLAYAVCALAFAAYHVWEYALAEPLYWVLMLQYVPVTLLLCRLYEKTESIWSSILLHALSNGVSMLALYGMERMGL